MELKGVIGSRIESEGPWAERNTRARDPKVPCKERRAPRERDLYGDRRVVFYDTKVEFKGVEGGD
jgi:hypothetical protein